MVNPSAQLKSNKIYIELSERSLDIYKAYAESKTQQLAPRPRAQALFQKQDSSYSLNALENNNSNNNSIRPTSSVNNTSVYRPPDYKVFASSPDYAKFFDLQELNSHPHKYLSESNFGVYLNFLNVGYGGPKEPSEKSVRLYEEFCR